MHKVLLLPGDGIGPEVVSATVQAIEALTDQVEFVTADAGRRCYESTRRSMAPEAMDAIAECDAVLMGAFAPAPDIRDYRDPEDEILRRIDAKAEVRRIKKLAPSVGRAEIDCYIVTNRYDAATVSEMEDVDGITRQARMQYHLCRRAFETASAIAGRTGRRRIRCITGGSMFAMTDRKFSELFRETLDPQGMELSDGTMAMASRWASDGRVDFDIAVVPEVYYSILGDGLAAATGGTYLSGEMAPGNGCALFKPSHGHAPELADLNCANPTGSLMSGSMMLRYLGLREEADTLAEGVTAAYKRGYMPKDLGGDVGAFDFGRQVARYCENPF